jgi:hypothetical protein
MAKIIKSVTLVGGEKFTLPPNSKLLGGTDIDALTSNCDIPTLEALSCYIAAIGSGGDGGDTEMFEGGGGGSGAHISGFTFNDVDTNFTASYGSDVNGVFNLTALGIELSSLIGGIVQTANAERHDNSRGAINYFLIQTIPSIANNLKLIFRGSAPLDLTPSTNSQVFSRISFSTRESFITNGYTGIPLCPVIISA